MLEACGRALSVRSPACILTHGGAELVEACGGVEVHLPFADERLGHCARCAVFVLGCLPVGTATTTTDYHYD